MPPKLVQILSQHVERLVTELPQPIPITAQPQRWSRDHPAQAALIYGLSYMATGLAGNALVARTASDIAWWLIIAAVGVLTLVFALLLTLSVCRIVLRPRAEAVWMVGAGMAFVAARPLVLQAVGKWLAFGGTGVQAASGLSPGRQMVGNIALILWAIFLGRLVSRVIKEGKLLLPVAVVASIADVITVFRGVVAKLTEEAPRVLQTFSATLPVAPPKAVSVPVLTEVGLGDFLFLALFLAVALRYSMNAAKTVWAAFAAMLVAPLAFFIWPKTLETGLPGLPFISAGVLAVNWRHLQYSPAERRALAVSGALVGALVAVIWLVIRR